ncbi:unnamed protein product [Phytophthora fragariaefolia]|uniref:Unnamed protein product n=1 Tax=Phytophthora fragariaefolia TaxID=1490495 RepID=A0A9W6XZ81_9STRA|nr:unnamed protein product [Phytophthora fragariaefolia]
MESLGSAALATLNDFFDDDDVIGAFILMPRETPLSGAELATQLKNFGVKRELEIILSQFDARQLALRTLETVSLYRKVAAKYDRITCQLAADDGTSSVVELQYDILQLKRE